MTLENGTGPGQRVEESVLAAITPQRQDEDTVAGEAGADQTMQGLPVGQLLDRYSSNVYARIPDEE